MSASDRTVPRLISTPRLVLNPVQVDDAEDQVVAVRSSLEELGRWMPWAQQEQTLLEAERNLSTGNARFYADEGYDWVIRAAATNDFLGRVSLFAIDSAVPKGELGYWLATKMTGRGYMREAVQAVVDAALATGYRRLEIRCDSRNSRSIAVAEASGFTRDALFRHDGVAADDPTSLRDTVIYSIVP